MTDIKEILLEGMRFLPTLIKLVEYFLPKKTIINKKKQQKKKKKKRKKN